MGWPRRAAALPPEATLEQRVAALEADQEAAVRESELHRKQLEDLQARLGRIVKAISAQLGTRID